MLWIAIVAPLASLIHMQVAAGAITVRDDLGHDVSLPMPAARVISLAPSVTEMLFAVGAGATIVGTSEFSDFPDAARDIPRIGRHDKLNLEEIVALGPDLVIGWHSGNPRDEIGHLRELGLTVYLSEPRDLDSIAVSLERFGQLTGHTEAGLAAARAFRSRMEQVFPQHLTRAPVGVFYQVWDVPLVTLNGKHLVSEIIRRCGGRNVFSDLPVLAPTVTTEAVLAADPEVIIGGMLDADRTGLWRDWPGLRAVRNGHIYAVSADLMHRHTPRLLDGAAQMCGILKRVIDAESS